MSGLAKSAKRQGAHACVFCEQGKNNEGMCGKLLSRAGITAHYFCMLFSSGLCQNGDEKRGVLGFMPDDIRTEVKRGFKLRCTYCRSKGATIGCVIKNCRRVFHLHCGRRNNTLHQYFDNFSSFCPAHRPQQDVVASREATEVCSICMVDVSTTPGNDNIQAPCCRRCWYHRECVQQHALSAGLYFFKCPLCNNKDEFQREMLTFGIYIPDQDASWETEPAAYHELLERYRHCDAACCRCPEGRNHHQERNKWEIILCDFCGSQGCHAACKHLLKLGKKDICPECYLIDQREKAELLAKRTPEKRKSLELLRQLEMATSPDSEKQAGSSFPGPSGHYRKAGIPKKVQMASALSSKPGVQKRNNKPTASKSSVSTASAASNNRYSLPGPSYAGAVERKRKCSGSSDASTSRKEKKAKRSLDLTGAGSSSSSAQRSKNSRKSRKAGSESLLTLIQNSVLKKKGKKLLTKNIKQRRAAIRNGSSSSSNRAASEASTSSGISGTYTDPLKKSPLSKQSKKKKKSVESDPLQTTLTNWLKPESSSSTEQKRNKSLPSSLVSTHHEKVSRSASVKLPVIQWRGRKLLIRSPRVVLERPGLETLNKRLEIDMQDGNDGLWSTELDTLTSMEAKGRITRNMVHSHEQPSAAERCGEREPASRNMVHSQEQPSARNIDSAAKHCGERELASRNNLNQMLDSSPSKNLRKRMDGKVCGGTIRGMDAGLSISPATHSQKRLNISNSALDFKADKKKDGLWIKCTELNYSPVRNTRGKIAEGNSDQQDDIGATTRTIDIRTELDDSPAKNLRKYHKNSLLFELDATDKKKDGITIKCTPTKLGDSLTNNMRSQIVEENCDQANDGKQKDNMMAKIRIIDLNAELDDSPAKNLRNNLKHSKITEPDTGADVNLGANSRTSRSPVRSPAQKVLSFPLEPSTDSLKSGRASSTDDKLIMSEYYSSKHSTVDLTTEGKAPELQSDWSDDSDIVELPMLGAIVGMM